MGQLKKDLFFHLGLLYMGLLLWYNTRIKQDTDTQ
jgi:hypothetical protein